MPRSRYVWKQYRKFKTIVSIYTGRKNEKIYKFISRHSHNIVVLVTVAVIFYPSLFARGRGGGKIRKLLELEIFDVIKTSRGIYATLTTFSRACSLARLVAGSTDTLIPPNYQRNNHELPTLATRITHTGRPLFR